MKLLAMPNAASLLEHDASQATDTVGAERAEPRASVAGTAAGGEMSLESSMTDDDSSRADVVRPRRLRRHRGADDVFPTRAIHRHQVC